ncbi:MAG: mannitol dehydrogenase family protein, partial [Lachnospiraceae bacterium]|nr:mannitol dehydrogenase family protein [Lachnospiraceae bacterium]
MSLILTENGVLNHKEEWKKAGYDLPEFDRKAVIKNTREKPMWVHFGAGNIFRAFQANIMQELLNDGSMDSGLIAVDGFDSEIIEKMYKPHDCMGILVTLKSDGMVDKTVIGSIVEALAADRENVDDMARLIEIFESDSLQMVSFTITEKGYSLVDGKGELLSAVKADMGNKPDMSVSYIGKVTSLLYARFLAGAKPVAMVSMDNCSHNGDKLYNAVHEFAVAWEKAGHAETGFTAYIEDKNKVSFPWTMIDKITPR